MNIPVFLTMAVFLLSSYEQRLDDHGCHFGIFFQASGLSAFKKYNHAKPAKTQRNADYYNHFAALIEI
jgi:hypothetical protein